MLSVQVICIHNIHALQGAYDMNHVYSDDMIKRIIDYAKARGIRVIVEFDTPVSGGGYKHGDWLFAPLLECSLLILA